MGRRNGGNPPPEHEKPPSLTTPLTWHETENPPLRIHTHMPIGQVFEPKPRPRRAYPPQLKPTNESRWIRSKPPRDLQRQGLKPTPGKLTPSKPIG